MIILRTPIMMMIILLIRSIDVVVMILIIHGIHLECFEGGQAGPETGPPTHRPHGIVYCRLQHSPIGTGLSTTAQGHPSEIEALLSRVGSIMSRVVGGVDGRERDVWLGGGGATMLLRGSRISSTRGCTTHHRYLGGTTPYPPLLLRRLRSSK